MAETGFMAQYWRLKGQYPDTLVLFQCGDFYEAFGEDAELIARTLDVVLTRRTVGVLKVPMAGFPVGASASYVRRLVDLGHTVALCHQTGAEWDGKRTVEVRAP